VSSTTLKTVGPSVEGEGMRMSMGFDLFVRDTLLPPWFPLANLQVGQQVLGMFNMKKDNSGNARWDEKAIAKADLSTLQSAHVPMEPRSRFRVAVVGGGIAGLSCCLEVFRQCERDGLDVEVVLLEGRSRLGGRLCTDTETFKASDGVTPFPVDLGASWIHGIDLNPLAALARESGVDFVTTSEEVKMLKAGMKEVDKVKDESAGVLFDKLLDLAVSRLAVARLLRFDLNKMLISHIYEIQWVFFQADDCWALEDVVNGEDRNQTAVRWYASVLSDADALTRDSSVEVKGSRAKAEDAPLHRQSSDMSVDRAIGNAIAHHKLSEFSRLSEDERRMLVWNLKNVEYALGANISDLSMKFWDIDERHAFEGDHVILKQGYSVVIDHLLAQLKRREDRFKCILDFAAGKIEYARRSTTQLYVDSAAQNRRLVELSDTCCITSQNSDSVIKCDFAVCAVPLGVLKESIIDTEIEKRLQFHPQLPDLKCDAIKAIGFGLLDKIYLQFSSAFWRTKDVIAKGQLLFGNATGVNPHQYMFFDVGKTLDSSPGAPAILMSLISGNEAVDCEWLSDEDIVDQTLQTLRTMFSKSRVPDPTAFRRTRWGSDRFSRGSYTFLTPGTTDQDFQILQSPINSNGDSIVLEGSETMRLFFAGEHTTALHPSMAHGAMLSGIRAAKEVVAAMSIDVQKDDDFDRLIPSAVFRQANPQTQLECSLCHLKGTRVREGSLFAFQRGSRQVLVHNNCAENCPEVEVSEGQWRHVIRAVNRGKAIKCFLCGQNGATIGCTDEKCFRCYHFSCAEDTGWRFDNEGKVFFCDLHRTDIPSDCVKLSMAFYRSKLSAGTKVGCALCGNVGDDSKAGKLLAFRERTRMAAVHEMCIMYTNIVDTTAKSENRIDNEFRNVFSAIDLSRKCARCDCPGATVGCSDPSCKSVHHYACAEMLDWKFEKQRSKFSCLSHRKKRRQTDEAGPRLEDNGALSNGMFHHALFSLSAADNGTSTPNVAANLDIGGATPFEESDSLYFSSDSDDESKVDEGKTFIVGPLTSLVEANQEYESCFVRVHRQSVDDRWKIELQATRQPKDGSSSLSVASCMSPNPFDGLQEGDVIKAINGSRVGSDDLVSLDDVLQQLDGEIDLILEVQREL